MDWELVWRIGSVVVLGPILYIVRKALNDIQALDRRLTDTREDVVKNYASRTDVRDMVKPIIDRIEKFETKLENKIDALYLNRKDP